MNGALNPHTVATSDTTFLYFHLCDCSCPPPPPPLTPAVLCTAFVDVHVLGASRFWAFTSGHCRPLARGCAKCSPHLCRMYFTFCEK